MKDRVIPGLGIRHSCGCGFRETRPSGVHPVLERPGQGQPHRYAPLRQHLACTFLADGGSILYNEAETAVCNLPKSTCGTGGFTHNPWPVRRRVLEGWLSGSRHLTRNQA
jgi:hypothetical protein